MMNAWLLTVLALGSNAVAAEALSQREVVAVLAGAAEVAPHVRLADRQTDANRELARNYLAKTFGGLGYQAELHAYTTGVNVLATLSATVASDRYIVVGAHYDSVYTAGANDNATGVAMVMSVAEALRDVTPRNFNFIFALFDEEEAGLVGSHALAKEFKAQKLRIHSVHTADQMGWDKNRNRAIELEMPSANLKALYQSVHDQGGYTFPLWVTSTTSTDHSSFRQQGYEAIGLTEEYVHGDTTPYYHSPKDTFDTVDFDYLKSSTDFFFAVLKTLALTVSE